MYPIHSFNPLQHNPFSPIAPVGPQSTYHVLPAGTHPNYGGYNNDWGPEQQQAFWHHLNQMTGGEPSPHGMAATTNNNDFQCKWLTGGILCTQGFNNFGDLMDHLGRVHDVQGPAERKLHCQWVTDRGLCSKNYRRDAFRRHIGTHVGCSVPCTECGKPFSRKDSMRAHLKKHHG